MNFIIVTTINNPLILVPRYGPVNNKVFTDFIASLTDQYWYSQNSIVKHCVLYFYNARPHIAKNTQKYF